MPSPGTVRTARPTICLNMIVRDEAHVITELLDAVAPYISSWVIVDTGSEDGTQELIRNHMVGLGISGQLYERPWRNFAENRTEALILAQGRSDYIWVIDADDIVVGTPDFTRLDGDVYWLRYKDSTADIFWQPWLFRNGVGVRWVGVTHEYADWDRSFSEVKLWGDYHVEYRTLGTRTQSGQKHINDRDLLLAEVERNPHDARSVFYLAQTYFCLRDFDNARKWYARRAEMAGYPEEVYYSLWRIAVSMSLQDVPWPHVQDAYLRAWEFRPTRAEPLYEIARTYRRAERYQLGYLFAAQAASVPLPADTLFVCADIYTWHAMDEQAVCASWIDKHAEGFLLCRRLLKLREIPDDDRQRITRNRDLCAPAMIDAAAQYPASELIESLRKPRDDAEVTVTLIAGPDRADIEQTLNSFLHCCNDVQHVGRFLAVERGLSDHDRAILSDRYGFLEFVQTGGQIGQIRAEVDTRFWLHLGLGWRFFAPEDLITRLVAVLAAETRVFQVGVNFADATQLTGTTASEQAVRRAPDAGRYVLTEQMAHGPAMFDTALFDRVGAIDDATALRTASLDEVLCIVHKMQAC